MKEPAVTLALGGGGARGLAHLGVIEVLRASGIRIERTVGVSIGSIIGAIAAFEPDIKDAQRKVSEFLRAEPFQRHQAALYGTSRRQKSEKGSGFLWFNRVREYVTANRLVHRVMLRPSFLSTKLLEEVVENLLPDADISEALTPLTIVAVDLKTGEHVKLETGSVRKAVIGSASLPGIFPPVEVGNYLLSDVGVFCALPTTISRSYQPDHLVAVDVSPSLESIHGCETALDVMMRMEEIGGTLFRDYVLSLADVIVRPEVGTLEWSDFSEIEGVVERGRAAARAVLPMLQSRFGIPLAAEETLHLDVQPPVDIQSPAELAVTPGIHRPDS